MLKGKDCYYDMPGIFRSLEDIEALTYDHLHNDTGREELQGQPKLLGLAGPMYNGEIDGLPVIHYEFPVRDHDPKSEYTLNSMCRYCYRRTSGACEGTTCKVWTGCVRYERKEMTLPENKARIYLVEQSIQRLLEQWEATTNNNDPHIPTVRGWLMDEISFRYPKEFDKWLEGEALDENLKNYILGNATVAAV